MASPAFKRVALTLYPSSRSSRLKANLKSLMASCGIISVFLNQLHLSNGVVGDPGYLRYFFLGVDGLKRFVRILTKRSLVASTGTLIRLRHCRVQRGQQQTQLATGESGNQEFPFGRADRESIVAVDAYGDLHTLLVNHPGPTPSPLGFGPRFLDPSTRLANLSGGRDFVLGNVRWNVHCFTTEFRCPAVSSDAGRSRDEYQ